LSSSLASSVDLNPTDRIDFFGKNCPATKLLTAQVVLQPGGPAHLSTSAPCSLGAFQVGASCVDAATAARFAFLALAHMLYSTRSPAKICACLSDEHAFSALDFHLTAMLSACDYPR